MDCRAVNPPYNNGMANKRGRPRKPDNERAEQRVELRVRSEEKGDWEWAAAIAGMSFSGWVRDRLNKAAAREGKSKG